MSDYLAISIGGEPYDLIKQVQGRDGSEYGIFRHLPGYKISVHPTGKRHVKAAGGFYEDITLSPSIPDVEAFVDHYRYRPTHDKPLIGLPDPTIVDPGTYLNEGDGRRTVRFGQFLLDFARESPPLEEIHDPLTYAETTAAPTPVIIDPVTTEMVVLLDLAEGWLPLAFPTDQADFMSRLATAPGLDGIVGPIWGGFQAVEQAAKTDENAREQYEKFEAGMQRAIDPALLEALEADMHRLCQNILA